MMAQIQEEKDRLNLSPKKFNMWLFIFTSFMLFAAFTSGFIVYAGGRGHGLNVLLPDVFKYSTAVIIISSVTLFLASRAAKRSPCCNRFTRASVSTSAARATLW